MFTSTSGHIESTYARSSMVSLPSSSRQRQSYNYNLVACNVTFLSSYFDNPLVQCHINLHLNARHQAQYCAIMMMLHSNNWVPLIILHQEMTAAREA